MNRKEQLLEFVKRHHGEQVRKYTNEPYWHHVLSVAELAEKHESKPLAWEIGVCHDLLEDTECTYNGLFIALTQLGYTDQEAQIITEAVDELTDRFTKEEYPHLNRKSRKRFEAQRLGLIDPLAQSVKYADLIDNTTTIVKHDKGFAEIYLKEKEEILLQMQGGNHILKKLCNESLKAALQESRLSLKEPHTI